jgi:hypothetical protein
LHTCRYLGIGRRSRRDRPAARAANEGLQNEADTDRYEWYAEALEELDERYEKAGIAGRVKELHAVEELSYKEMRRFLRTHDTARFLL